MSFNVDTGVQRTTSELERKIQTTNGYRTPWVEQNASPGSVSMTQMGGDLNRQPKDIFRFQSVDNVYNDVNPVFRPLSKMGTRINYTSQQYWKCDDPETDVKENAVYPVKISVSATLPRELPINDSNVANALELYVTEALGTFQQNWPRMVYAILTPETLPEE